MTEAVILSTARTPVGKAYRGALNDTHGHAIGEEPDLVERHRMAGSNGRLHAGRFFRLDTDDADIGAQELDEAGNAGGQAAPANGNVDGADLARMLAQQFLVATRKDQQRTIWEPVEGERLVTSDAGHDLAHLHHRAT